MKKKYLFFRIVLLGLSIGCFILAGVVSYIKLAYPFAYSKEVFYYSDEYNLDPSLVFSIINEESGFNTLSVSKSGAIGLMQIMPKTGEFVADKLGLDYDDSSVLFNPDVNIQIGCYYLRYLFNKYNDLNKVLFSYNAGEGVMQELYNGEDIKIVESIEINETKNYIKRVTKTRNAYNKLISFSNSL